MQNEGEDQKYLSSNEEVEDIAKQLKNNKSPGINDEEDNIINRP